MSNPFGELSRVLFSEPSGELAGAETVHGTLGVRCLLAVRILGGGCVGCDGGADGCLYSCREASKGILRGKTLSQSKKKERKSALA